MWLQVPSAISNGNNIDTARVNFKIIYVADKDRVKSPFTYEDNTSNIRVEIEGHLSKFRDPLELKDGGPS